MTRPRLRIAIVGGSIAGCSAAIELLRDGHDAQIFERAGVQPQGAGIGLLPATFASLVDRKAVDPDLPRIEIVGQVFAARDSHQTPLGRIALELQFPTLVVNWTDLLGSLRSRVPVANYHFGREVSGVSAPSATSVRLQFSDGTVDDFDLVVFADGYRSLGRSWVAPESRLEFRGYTLWRGLVPEAALQDPAPLQRRIFRLSHATLRGHTALYSIPAGAGSATQLVNFASYLPLPAAELKDFLHDRAGRLRTGSLPPGSMRPTEEARLKARLRSELPPYFAALVELASDTFAQPIFSVAPLRQRLKRCVLLGDAGALVQPLTGSGVREAIANATSLAANLRSTPDIEAALAAYDADATSSGKVLVDLGAHMEQRLVWQIPDFAELGESELVAFWKAATRLAG